MRNKRGEESLIIKINQVFEDFTAQLWEWKGWIVEQMARPGAVQQLAGSSYLAAASLTRAPTAAGVKKRQNLQHPENYNRNTIPKHKRQMLDRQSIVAHWYPRAVPLRSWATVLDVAHFNIISQALAMSTPSAAPTMKFLFCVFLLLIIEIYTDDWGGAGSEGAYEHLKGHLNPFII